jgi:glycosyltransferase involved in cell wall biosynthesis
VTRGRPGVGLVSVDANGYWPGGRYYLHHIIRSVALLPEQERLPMRDVWWLEKNESDTSFNDVRDHIGESAVIRPPEQIARRLVRRMRRFMRRRDDFGDLFGAAGVDVLFPTSACETAGVPLVYWLTDFQHRRRPDLYTAELLDWFENNFARKVGEAELVMLSSRDAYGDFLRYFPEQEHKARFAPCVSLPQSDWFSLDPASVARAKNLQQGYFVLPNQFTEHKNHLTVFEAARRLKERGVEIQIACTGHSLDYKGKRHIDRLMRFIDEHRLSDNIRMVGFLPRAEQMALYRGARAILQPSQFEGWSSAVEDARSLGRHMIVSDIAIHREKELGSSAVFVQPDDADGWADAMLAATNAGVNVSRRDEEAAVRQARTRAIAAGRTFVEVMREAIARAAGWRAA